MDIRRAGGADLHGVCPVAVQADSLSPFLRARGVRYRHARDVRALVLVDSNDPNTWVADTQYLLGPDLLVCPVLAPGVDSLRVYLPNCTWYDYWSGEQCSGGQWQDVSVTLDRIPLFVRGGAVLVLGPDEEWVGRHGGEPLTLLIYPDAADRALSSLRHERGVATFTYAQAKLTASGPLPVRTLVAHLGHSGASVPVM
jgi:alpha-glucosidase (family GH31 glycosyl hydrolase)